VSVQQLPIQLTVHQVHVHVTVDQLLCVIFALLTAASNAVAAVLQRKAAAQVPTERSMHVSLIADLIHRPVWLAGIAMVIVAALAQATALAFGPLALVQPIFIIELPITLVLSTLLFRGRDALHLLPWRAIIITTVALGGGLAAAQPSGAIDSAENRSWMIALIVTAAFETVLISTAVGLRGEPRAALLGLAAACGYALTAALLKNAIADLNQGVVEFFTSWHIYAVRWPARARSSAERAAGRQPGRRAADADRRRRADQHCLWRHPVQRGAARRMVAGAAVHRARGDHLRLRADRQVAPGVRGRTTGHRSAFDGTVTT
jgi:hypothetical protein